MKCPACKKVKEPGPTTTCSSCLEKARIRNAAAKELDTPLSWADIQKVFELSPEEAHAVDMAAGQAIIRRRWKLRHRGKWPGVTAEALVDGATPDRRRRSVLLASVSRLIKFLLWQEGINSRSFFNGAVK